MRLEEAVKKKKRHRWRGYEDKGKDPGSPIKDVGDDRRRGGDDRRGGRDGRRGAEMTGGGRGWYRDTDGEAT